MKILKKVNHVAGFLKYQNILEIQIQVLLKKVLIRNI